MAPRSPPFPILCGAAALLAGACVRYAPSATYTPQPPAPPYAQEAAPATPDRAAAEPSANLDALLGPIALYPDPLLALILTASTVPGDISAASAYLIQYGDMTQIDRQPWDPSVRSLARYPSVITWLAENPAWTRALGEAFLAAPGEVMQAVQRLRNQAISCGALASNPEQQVLSGGAGIAILPAQADVVYVPAYDSDVVYGSAAAYGADAPLVNFGPAFAAGPWLSYDMDWLDDEIWEGEWTAWHGASGWYAPRFHASHTPGIHRWRPKGGSTGVAPRGALEAPAPRPRLMQGTPRPQARAPAAGSAAPQASRAEPGAALPGRPAAPGQAAHSAPATPSHAAAAHQAAAAPANEAAPAPASTSDTKNH